MPHKNAFRILALCICLITFGCTIQPTQPAEPIYVVNTATAMKGTSSFEDQSIELRNCDGKTEHNPLADHAQVADTIVISDSAISAKDGKAIEISADTKSIVIEKVKQTYQQMYDEAKANVEQTDLTVPSGSINTYKIYWTQQVIDSTISFQQNRETYTVSYTYKLDIPKSIIELQTGCTG
jgi:hypothetical protein